MTYKLTLEVRTFQLSSAKRFGTVERKHSEAWIPPKPYSATIHKNCEAKCFFPLPPHQCYTKAVTG